MKTQCLVFNLRVQTQQVFPQQLTILGTVDFTQLGLYKALQDIGHAHGCVAFEIVYMSAQEQLQQLVESLAELPIRGAVVKELALLGIHEYRELYFKPYRVIYRQLPSGVYVYLIADGRRNMQSLLQRRLLG